MHATHISPSTIDADEAPPSGQRVTSAAPDQCWRALSARGEEAFAAGRDTQARQLYEEALEEAETLFSAAEASNGGAEAAGLAPVLYGTSCHKVAELARRQRDAATEGIYIYRAFERLVGAVESPEAAPALRAACLAGLEVALNALVFHLTEQGRVEKALLHSERARAARCQFLSPSTTPVEQQPLDQAAESSTPLLAQPLRKQGQLGTQPAPTARGDENVVSIARRPKPRARTRRER
jgi:hypothetical protein